MSPSETLKEAARLGLRLVVSYDQLTVTPASRCPGYVWDAMRANRSELLRLVVLRDRELQHRDIIRDFLAAAGQSGGRKTQSQRTPEQRSRFGQMMARARWERWRRQREAVGIADLKVAERKDRNG